MTEFARIFMEYNFPVTQELCVKFLTITVSVLVFSVTFSEKIIKFNNATKLEKRIIKTAWISLIFAIILCGIGLVIHTIAGGQAVWGNFCFEVDKYVQNNDSISYINNFASAAYILITLAGVSFIFGLIMIVVSAIKSKVKQE
ncbi:MAG: hypothetical protein AAF611_08510 [Bacteroidota bacterium]